MYILPTDLCNNAVLHYTNHQTWPLIILDCEHVSLPHVPNVVPSSPFTLVVLCSQNKTVLLEGHYFSQKISILDLTTILDLSSPAAFNRSQHPHHLYTSQSKPRLLALTQIKEVASFFKKTWPHFYNSQFWKVNLQISELQSSG